MKNRDRNRLAAFYASLSVLNQPEYKPLWFDQPPKIFTRLVAEAAEWGITQAAIDSVQQESDEFEWVVGFETPDGLRRAAFIDWRLGVAFFMASGRYEYTSTQRKQVSWWIHSLALRARIGLDAGKS